MLLHSVYLIRDVLLPLSPSILFYGLTNLTGRLYGIANVIDQVAIISEAALCVQKEIDDSINYRCVRNILSR